MLGAEVGGYALAGVIGFFASLAAWAVVIFSLVPRFRIGPKMAKWPVGDDRFEYRVKVHNSASRRLIADFHAEARIELRGLDGDRPSTWLAIPVPLTTTNKPFSVLRADTGRIFHLRLDLMQQPGVVALEIIEATRPVLRAQMEAGTVELEDILNLGNDARLLLVVGGAHPLSGIRRTRLADFKKPNVDTHGWTFDPDSERLLPP